MRALRYTLCDVFTDRPLTGNALAVFTNAGGLDDATLQALAREMNLSETVFVLPPQQGGHFRLRIFTPRREIPFAGHPTLGAALVVGRSVQLEQLLLETGRGLVPVRIEHQAELPVFGWMTQPLPTVTACEHPASLLDALGLTRAVLPIQVYDNGIRHALVAVESATLVEKLAPDLLRLSLLPVDCTSVFAGQGQAWKTRAFAPQLGIAEDPATGSAAGPLGLHLVRHGVVALGTELMLDQGTEIQRPSRLWVRVLGDGEQAQAVEVGGQAVVVGRGELKL
jgi:trans-2,3-dihydro-3-hydroxyanthranilate isomerase